jgi:hypothetical protein
MLVNVTLQAGTYYIGCPSRVTENKTFKRGQTGISVGNFLGSDSTEFHVESGFIAIIPYEKLSVYKEEASDFGIVRHFKHPVQFICRNGLFTILSGKYILDIDTYQINEDDEFTFEDYDADCDDEDEDDEDDEEDDDEDDEDEDDEDDDDDDDEEKTEKQTKKE